jgi:5-methylcytosine-specific restriction endonuclease McrA
MRIFGIEFGRTYPAAARKAMEAHRRAFPACVACGASPVEVHHIVPVAVAPEAAADPDNLLSLCERCHIVHGHAGDPACRRYVENVEIVIGTRIVKTI